MKTYDVVLYECSSCAYATSHAGNAAKHATTKKCSGGSMSGKSHRLVKFEDAASRQETTVGRETTTAPTITTVPGFECSACGYATGDRSNAAKHAKKCGAEIALAHLRVSVLSTRPRVAAPRFRMPEKAVERAEESPKLERPGANMRTDMMRAIPRLGAQKMDITSIEDLPALLFRAARGTDAPARHIAVDGNTVLEMGPRGGVEQTPIDKFVRRVLADAEGACGTCGGQDLRDEFEAKNVKGGRRGELHSRSDLIRMYSSGDHGYYKASFEGRDFIKMAADAVKAELDALRVDSSLV